MQAADKLGLGQPGDRAAGAVDGHARRRALQCEGQHIASVRVHRLGQVAVGRAFEALLHRGGNNDGRLVLLNDLDGHRGDIGIELAVVNIKGKQVVAEEARRGGIFNRVAAEGLQ